MDLLKLELKGFRRFESASIDLLGRLVAIVGPNEAGKSSLLDALTRLNTDEPLLESDLTRAARPGDDAVVLTVTFALDSTDKAVVGHIGEASGAKRFVVTKLRSGRRRGRIEPRVVRKREPRVAASRLLAKIADSRWAAERPELIAERWPDAKRSLDADVATLNDEQLGHVNAVVEMLSEEPSNTNPGRLRTVLETVIESERQPHPHSLAVDLLMPRLPEFLLFGEGERTLGSAYDLMSVADAPPAALSNFANLARIRLAEARDIAARSDFGELETVQRAANRVLANVFSSGWRQSVMRVQVRFDRGELRPIVQNRSGRFTELGERSDGLRTFVALVAYLAKSERRTLPILLIDEAETHLHYDAQADLIRVLASQDASSKVIYTTHSAGCLPLDLGTGIRVVRMLDGDRSEVDDHFWTSGGGFTPLVMAMGAAALAFTPTRRALIGEGITEAMLLPSMLREAVDPLEVDYQVAPGLSNADRETINALDLEATRVAFLVDGDKSGRERKKFLRRIGVPETRVATLGSSIARDVVLEDLLRPELYREAVNAELSTWAPTKELPASAVRNRGRVVGVAEWCRRNGVAAPDKRRVAAQVLSLAHNLTLTTPSSRAILKHLHSEIRDMLDRPSFPNAAATATGD